MSTHRLLHLDAEAEVERIVSTIRTQLGSKLRRKGVVLGLSGGIDSSVVAALAVRALGPERVLGLFMPERHSDPASLRLGALVAGALGITAELEDIAPTLEAVGCYRRQEEAIRRVVPAFGPGFRFKLVLPAILGSDRLSITRLVVQAPDGETHVVRLDADTYRALVAATNYKQRVRKMVEYFHADRLHYAVAGTPNRLEYELGFFVKHGDGCADLKPIAHLYKSQVYQLAEVLGVPDEIVARPPTTDTFSLAQTQEEFYFALPLRSVDVCLYALDHGLAAKDVSALLSLSEEDVARVFADILAKRRTTQYLHQAPLLVDAAAVG